jgi:two-component system, cell cycle response regulator
MKITRIDRLAGTVARHEREARPRWAPRLSRGWPGRGWFMVLGIFLLLYVSWLIWGWIPFNQDLVGQVILLPINAAAAVLAWQASRNVQGRHRLALAWRLIALGLFGQLAGAIASGVYSLFGQVPYPSLADPLYLSFYPLMLAALLALPHRRQSRSQNLRLGLDLATTALGAATVVWYVLIAPTARAGGQSTLQMAVSLAYPVGDVILIVGVASLLLRGVPDSTRRALWLVAAALGLFVIGDSLYAYVALHSVFANSDALNVTYALAFALFVLAARCQRPAEAGTADVTRQRGVSWMPYVAVASGFVVLLISELSKTSGTAVIAVAATALAVMVAARQLLGQRELVAAQAELKTLATTDGLTGLGNRRILLAELHRQAQTVSSARPSLLILLDLNGFKNYNDSFGHPAGDALLARLANALTDAVEPFGARAYRPGGDEFCVIANDASQQSALERAATCALSETGKGFAISTAFGRVVIPNDATSATEAMRAADIAMYAQKSSGRATAGRQSTDVLLSALTEHHPNLGDHLTGVAELVQATARDLDIDGDQLSELRDAAALHDIGKIAIPDSIINKPVELTQEEWVLMKQHTLIGERIVTSAPALRAAAPLVRSSHEAFDGSGYPDGLAGDAIPIGARVIAVCDAFDAMISNRSYSPAITIDDALAELKRCAGTQFDPAIVTAFQRIMAERRGVPTQIRERKTAPARVEDQSRGLATPLAPHRR